MIRILLIEDLAVVRESLAMALSACADMEPLCCSSVEEAVDLLDGSSEEFDVVLFKLSAGGRKADALLSVANRKGLERRVLIITPGLGDSEHRRLASLSIAGIFAKQRPLSDLIRAIHAVAGGETWFDWQPSNQDTPNGTLSPQEKRVAESVLEGLANKEISARMGVSESCVKGLLQRAFLKLRVHTRAQLVRVFIEKSLETQPEPTDLTQLGCCMGRLGSTHDAVPGDP